MEKTAFWTGFIKTAKVYSSIMNALGSKQVSQKLLTGSEFAAKQQSMLAAHRAAKAAQKATQTLQSSPAQQFAAKAKTIAQNKVNQAGNLSAHAQNNLKNLNAGRNYRPEMVADLAKN